jgi:hypothetical protein
MTYVRDNIFNAIQDPKGIQGDLNYLSLEQRFNIKTKTTAIITKAIDAYNAGVKGSNPQKSINLWRDIFGGGFSAYG